MQEEIKKEKLNNEKGENKKRDILIAIAITLSVILFIQIVFFVVLGIYHVTHKSTVIETTNSSMELDKYTTEFDLIDFSGKTVEYSPMTIQDGEYEDFIEYCVQTYGKTTTISTGTINENDYAVVTFNGWLAKNTAKDGEQQEYDANMTTTEETIIKIGSNSFIEGFEEGLVGKEIGSTVTLNLKFPNNYGNVDYNAQDCVFEVKIVGKKEYSDTLTEDELLNNLIPKEFPDTKITCKNFDEFKQWVKEDMNNYYEYSNQQAKSNATLSTYLGLYENIEYTQNDIELVKKDVILQHEVEAQNYNIEKEELAKQYYGIVVEENDTQSAFDKLVEEDTNNALPYYVILTKYINENNISMTQEELDDYVSELSEQYNMTIDEIKESYIIKSEDGATNDYSSQLEKEALYVKAIETLEKQAKLVETLESDLEHTHDTTTDDTTLSSEQ